MNLEEQIQLEVQRKLQEIKEISTKFAQYSREHLESQDYQEQWDNFINQYGEAED